MYRIIRKKHSKTEKIIQTRIRINNPRTERPWPKIHFQNLMVLKKFLCEAIMREIVIILKFFNLGVSHQKNLAKKKHILIFGRKKSHQICRRFRQCFFNFLTSEKKRVENP